MDEPSEHSSPQPPLTPAPLPQPARKAQRSIGAIATGLGMIALKFKAIFSLLAVSWTFLLSLWLYVTFFGWRFGLVIVLLLLAHEMGHYFAFRAYGLPVRLPVFIPFIGAMTAGAMPTDLEQGAYIALAGPLTGLGLALACYLIGLQTNDRFWFACADVSAFLNLFNLIPLPPFDGARAAGAVWSYFQRGTNQRAARMTNAGRLRVSFWYVASAMGLFVLMLQSHALAGSSGMTRF